MASGQNCIIVQNVMPPAANFATPGVRAGGSTPAERVPIWQFGASANAHLDFYCELAANYDGGGLTFTLPFSAATATSGTVRLGIAIRRAQDDAEDIDAAHTYDYNTVDASPASAAGELKYPTISFTDGVDMDGWQPGEFAVVRVRRDVSVGGNMTGIAELWGLFGLET